jgi:3-dehydroquinate dehydratase
MSKSRKKNSRKYNVSTISLSDLLKKYEEPYEIDYLSIDTEGSEYDILKSFNFDEYNIKIITCEHNDSNTREKIFSLLSEKGYERKYVEFSRYDDWYVRK